MGRWIFRRGEELEICELLVVLGHIIGRKDESKYGSGGGVPYVTSFFPSRFLFSQPEPLYALRKCLR